ncbi:MAG: DUF1003 domain-containing protein [Hydrococcus sp. Prado102]|nr:DUF1003 domain-containing protein [Hydrococcus sp. Prado102]
MKTENSDRNSEFLARRNAMPTAPLPDPIAKSIDAIVELHTQEERDVPKHQRVLENISVFFGRPAFLYSSSIALSIWILGSLLRDKGILPFNPPAFNLLDQGIDVASLLISTGVLIRQTRQERFAEQRAQLMLQLNLLSEQKIAKLISLIEELRLDLPNVKNRYDPEAEVMQQAADPRMVLETLQENISKELSAAERDESTDNLETETSSVTIKYLQQGYCDHS